MWFTLSMADNHWFDLHQLAYRDKEGSPRRFPTFSSIQEEAKWKRKFCRKNPHLVDAYFYEKVKMLFKTVFSKVGIDLEWFWYRVEYQGRGAPHIHGCFKLSRDPKLTKHAERVFFGRQASRILNRMNLLDPSEDFDPYCTEFDVWKDDELSQMTLFR